jgi:CRP/FNR family cyclic AMP-dependent transcriptional regulator
MDSNLMQAAIFRGVDPAAVQTLADGLAPMYVRGGYVFFERGQQGDGLYVILSGKVKVGRRAPDGREHTFTIRGQGESFGELSVFDPGPRTSTATALNNASVVAIDGARFRAWAGKHPKAGDRLLRVLARRLRRTEELRSELTLNDVPGRLANELLRLAQRFGVQEDGATRVNHDLTQEELAQLIGSSRETVNKALSDFSRRGWIRLEGKSLVIAESDRLARRVR